MVGHHRHFKFGVLLVLSYNCVGGSANLENYPNCTSDDIHYIGDGNCDSWNNNEDCGWDEGDCCECTCIGGSDTDCESSRFFCKDPDSGCIDPLVTNYESCDGDLTFYGDGLCEAENNNEACGWDGGDCCECTCNGYYCFLLEGDSECEDPEAASGALGCLDWPSYPLPCSHEVQHKWEVSNTQQAQSLAEALNCSGGEFEVGWYGNIVVNQTLVVFGGTVLNVTGVGSGASMDGGDTTGLFIVIDSSLHLSNIVLTNGNSTLGAAIAALGSRVVLNQTSFIGNTAKHDGGALFVAEGSTLACGNETYFTNNRAGRQGGAVCARGYSHTTWTGRVIFFNNSAGGLGGAMSLLFGSNALWAGADGANCSNNNASFGGGLSIAFGSSSTWEGETNFEGNTASVGGGMYVNKGELVWRGISTFEGNSAGYDGGGLYVYEGELVWQGISTFEGNTAGWDGGGLYMDYSKASWSEASCSFRYNFAEDYGGALHASHSHISWTGEAIFSSNFVREYGGALYIDDNSTASWLASANFVDNYADEIGGALAMEEGSIALWMGDTTFANNSARYEGGALSVSLSSTIFWAGKMTFSNNTAGGNGGALYLEGNDSWEGETTFNDNVASSQGGAVYVADSGEVFWSANTSFINNSADSGGALFVASGSNVSWTAETNFISNQAQQDGGAASFGISSSLSSEESSTTVNIWGRTNFAYNKCGWSGGAMSLSGEVTLSSNATIIFLGNSADVYGGAVYISSVGVGPTFYGAQFHHNHAQIGGGVYAVTSGTTETTTFSSCSFVNNTSDTSGGGVNTASGKEDFVNTTFVGNVARAGGALQLSGTASITGCLFKDNIAESAGGPAIFNIGYISGAKSSSFFDNILSCEYGDFFVFSEGNDKELWEMVCEGCLVRCVNCTFEEPITVPECISLSDAGIEHASSSGGDTTIENLNITKGYWRATNRSTKVLKCYNDDACKGGVTGAKDFCSEGYEGAYCSVCSTGYTASLNFRCTPCTELKWGIAIAIIAGGVCLIVGGGGILYLLSAGLGGSRRSVVDRVARLVPFQSLKIIIVAWQIVTQFASVANVTFPDIYQRFLDGIDVLNFELSWVLSAGCVFSFDFHDQLLISTTLPIAAMIVLGITYVTAAGRHRHSDAALRIIRHKHVSLVLLITFLVYSSVSSTVFQMFACEDLDDGKNYLRADYRIECDSAKHKALQVYSVFMVMLYPVGIPCLYAGLLFKYRNTLYKAADREVSSGVDSISDLWKPYKPSRFYYEVIECVRRVSLTGAVVFIYPNTAAQIAVTLVMAFVFAMMSEGLAPYDSRWDCWINRTGHVIVFMSMYIALLLKVDVSSERASSQKLLASILVAAHACMVLAVVVEAVAMACSVTKPQSRDAPRRRVSHRLPFRQPKTSCFKTHGVSTFDGIEMRSCSTAESEWKSHD